MLLCRSLLFCLYLSMCLFVFFIYVFMCFEAIRRCCVCCYAGFFCLVCILSICPFYVRTYVFEAIRRCCVCCCVGLFCFVLFVYVFICLFIYASMLCRSLLFCSCVYLFDYLSMHPCHVCIHVLCGDADTLRGRLDAAVYAAMLVSLVLFVYVSLCLFMYASMSCMHSCIVRRC